MANRHTKPVEEVSIKAPEIQKEIATRIASHAQASNNSFSIDPFTIMAICSCIVSIVKLLYMCYSKESISAGMKKGSIIQRILLKREIRKHFIRTEDKRALYGAVIDVSTSLSEAELNDLLDSILEEN